MAKSTPDNPATTEVKGEEVAVETMTEATAREANIERAAIVKATHVKYIGTAHVAEISAADWRSLGVEEQKKLTFDKRRFRGDRVAIGDLTPGAIEYFELADSRFCFVDENGKRV